MANPTLFQAKSANIPDATAVNEAGGSAYEREPDKALALYAMTGTFGNTFYATAESQLDQVKALALKATSATLARVAVASREKGHMKDMPAFLMAVLAGRTDAGTALWARAFPRVIDNAKMIRNYVQIARSGVAGKVINLSSNRQRKAIQAWFDQASVENILRGSIGSDGLSLLNALRFARISPRTPEKRFLMRVMHERATGRDYKPATRVFRCGPRTEGFEQQFEPMIEREPQVLKDLRVFRADRTGEADVPNVDFRMLDGVKDGLASAQWAAIFKQGGWQFTRMNLNTATRHGVFAVPEMTKIIADRLRDPNLIQKARVFPYQVYQAFLATGDAPHEVREALQDALDHSLANIPDLGRVVVMPDVSGSMSHNVTGTHGNKKASVVRCVDVAALIASAILRKHPGARILPFETRVFDVRLNPRDSVATNAKTLASFNGGGTNCSAPLVRLNAEGYEADVLVYVSDNESWVDSQQGPGFRRLPRSTAMMDEWTKFKRNNPAAKLVCIDLCATPTTQVASRPDILQVAGFSDQVFDVIAAFREGGNSGNFWLEQIDKIQV